MARPATARRTADGRPGLVDRPTRRDLPAGTRPPTPARRGLGGDGPALSATPVRPIDPTPSADVTPGTVWSLLPAGDRERFGLRPSRLVLRAVQAPDPGP